MLVTSKTCLKERENIQCAATAMNAAPAIVPIVPISDIAPLVPAGTRRNVLRDHGSRLESGPISDAHVSAFDAAMTNRNNKRYAKSIVMAYAKAATNATPPFARTCHPSRAPSFSTMESTDCFLDRPTFDNRLELPKKSKSTTNPCQPNPNETPLPTSRS